MHCFITSLAFDDPFETDTLAEYYNEANVDSPRLLAV